MANSSTFILPPVYGKSVEGDVCDVDTMNMTIKATITTDSLDRDQEVILTEGLNLTCYDSNRVVLFMHDPFRPIGKSLWLKRDRGRLIAKTQFARKNPFAAEVFELYAEGIMKAWSIGMDPYTIAYRPCKDVDLRVRPDWKGCRRIIEKADLIEYSGVTVGANPDALNRAIGSGICKATKAYFERAAEYAQKSQAARSIEVVEEPPLTTRRVVDIVQSALREARGE